VVVVVRRDTGGTVMLIFGLILVRLVWDGGYQWYVKTSLMIPILLAAGLVVAVGAYQALTGRTDPDPDRSDGGPVGAGDHREEVSGTESTRPAHAGSADGTAVAPHAGSEDGTAVAPHTHPHGHGDRVGLLLLVPVLALLLIAPAPLGSFAAERGGENRVAESGLTTAFPELPDPVDGAVELPMSDYLSRVLHEEDTPVRGEAVRLVGFVTPDEQDDGFRLTRFVVGCCAADAIPLQVAIADVRSVPDRDTWLEAVVVWNGDVLTDESTPLDRVPVVELERSQVIERPDQPYEY
jgi:uncharacterized repeat protein (TIGR03943 family)